MKVKNTLFRWLLSTAMLFSMAGFSALAENKAVSFMPASQGAVKVDTSVSGNFAGSYKFQSGKLTVDAVGADGYRVVVDVNRDISYEDLRSLYVKVSSTAAFNIAFTDSNNKWHGLAADWYPSFGSGSTANLIVAGNYDVELSLYNAVTYDPNNIPANHIYHVKQLYIAIKKPGTLVLSKFEAGVASTTPSKTATTTKSNTKATTKASNEPSAATTADSSATTTTSEISTTTTLSSTTEATTTTQAITATEGPTKNKFPWSVVIVIVAVIIIGSGAAAFIIIKKKKQNA